jgi:hypothetical protein
VEYSQRSKRPLSSIEYSLLNLISMILEFRCIKYNLTQFWRNFWINESTWLILVHRRESSPYHSFAEWVTLPVKVQGNSEFLYKILHAILFILKFPYNSNATIQASFLSLTQLFQATKLHEHVSEPGAPWNLLAYLVIRFAVKLSSTVHLIIKILFEYIRHNGHFNILRATVCLCVGNVMGYHAGLVCFDLRRRWLRGRRKTSSHLLRA